MRNIILIFILSIIGAAAQLTSMWATHGSSKRFDPSSISS
jgi:hypothetical protein